MTINLKPFSGWAIGCFDPEDGWIYVAAPKLIFRFPQEVLDYLTTPEGQAIRLGASGLIWVHIQRNTSQATYHYFQTLRAANRFQASLSRHP
jgi:hypothetical protein